jgi:hypothetical protein
MILNIQLHLSVFLPLMKDLNSSSADLKEKYELPGSSFFTTGTPFSSSNCFICNNSPGFPECSGQM